MDKNKEMRVCPKCSNKNRADANFCTRCGTQLVENPVIVDYKSLEKCNPSDFEPIPRVQKKLKPMVENKELIKQYTEHMRQVLHHQQEAYFCMIKILTILGMDNDF